MSACRGECGAGSWQGEREREREQKNATSSRCEVRATCVQPRLAFAWACGLVAGCCEEMRVCASLLIFLLGLFSVFYLFSPISNSLYKTCIKQKKTKHTKPRSAAQRIINSARKFAGFSLNGGPMALPAFLRR